MVKSDYICKGYYAIYGCLYHLEGGFVDLFKPLGQLGKLFLLEVFWQYQRWTCVRSCYLTSIGFLILQVLAHKCR